jgi:hypothetical protein
MTKTFQHGNSEAAHIKNQLVFNDCSKHHGSYFHGMLLDREIMLYTRKVKYIRTYIPLTLYTQRGSRGISDIPQRHPRFAKIS